MSALHTRIRKRKSKKKVKVKRKRKITFNQLLKAIKDSEGSIRIIAERINRSYQTTYGLIKRSEDAQEAIRIEQERVADIAEETISEMMTQRIDFGTASRTARWLLERKYVERGYRPSKETIIQGGKNPLKIQNEELISVDELKSIPLEVRKRMLEEMKEKKSSEE